MEESKDVLCFHCTQPIGEPPVVNTIEGEDGEENCPACADRVLAAMPGIFPVYANGTEEPAAEVEEAEPAEWAQNVYQSELSFDDDDRPIGA